MHFENVFHYLECLCSFFMSGRTQVDAIYTENLVPTSQFSTQVCWTTGQNEWYKDTFTIFSTYDVKAQSCVTFAKYNSAHLPETTKESQWQLHEDSHLLVSVCL